MLLAPQFRSNESSSLRETLAYTFLQYEGQWERDRRHGVTLCPEILCSVTINLIND